MQTTLTPKPAGPGLHSLDLSRIAQDLQIRKIQVESVVQLLDEGNTVPFITRYRKERTGGLNEEIIRVIQLRINQLRQLADRKQTILKSIETQGKLTDELRDALLAADTPRRLEDLYLPYKPKKKTLASAARERGLEPAAQAIWGRDPIAANLQELLPTLVNPEKELPSVAEVQLGIQHILAEVIAEMAEVRGIVRVVLWDLGQLVTKKNEKLTAEQGLDFKDYFQFTEAIRHIPPHRILAINRGEKEGVLLAKLESDPAIVQRVVLEKLPLADHPHADLLRGVADDALNRLILPSLEREIRRELTRGAEEHAVSVFARNLRSLLLQRPLRQRRVLSLDPGFRTGCKLAVLDETGKLLEETVIFPHPPQNKKAEAKVKLEELIRKHQIPVIAIGNGTACRETEETVSELIGELERRRRGEIVAPAAVAPAPEPPAAQPPAAQPPAAQPPAAQPPAAQPPAEPVVAQGEPVAPEATPAALVAETTPAVPAEQATPADSAAADTIAAATEATAPQAVSSAVVATPPAPAPLPTVDPSLPEAPADLAYIVVNEAGASHYSVSAVGREEFPEYDATLRSTISIGRRLQDPLSELVKIEPQNIGVGLYQHDVHPRQLKDSLEAIVESCVNYVGVDLNTASVPLLRHVSGLNQLTAREVVEFRNQHGPFQSREQLLQVAGIGEVRFVQAAGFLKIGNGGDPLDRTWIHPESYGTARQLLTELGHGPESLLDRTKTGELQEKLKTVSLEEIAPRLQIGIPTLRDMIEALIRPDRDPRDELPPPIFKKGILRLEDLQPGMELKGTVLNVVDFGAFIDIGLKDSGLAHISQMANRYVKSPYDIVAVGDVVTVWVLTVDQGRRRVSLTMIKPGTERKPPERRPQAPRGEQGQGQGEQGGGRPQQQQRGRRPAPAGARNAPPRQQSPSGAQDAGAGQQRQHGRQPPQRQPPPPPRKPARPLPRPKLTKAALEGDTPLRTFRELEAFFAAKETEPVVTPVAPPPMQAEEAPTPPPVEETTPVGP